MPFTGCFSMQSEVCADKATLREQVRAGLLLRLCLGAPVWTSSGVASGRLALSGLRPSATCMQAACWTPHLRLSASCLNFGRPVSHPFRIDSCWTWTRAASRWRRSRRSACRSWRRRCWQEEIACRGEGSCSMARCGMSLNSHLTHVMIALTRECPHPHPLPSPT